MTFSKWLTLFKLEMGWCTVRGMQSILRMDYNEGLSPQDAARLWKSGKPRKEYEFIPLTRFLED